MQKRVKNISTSLVDADIEEYILQAEGVINLIMKSDYDFETNFDATKHRLLRDAATNFAAFYCVLYERNTSLSKTEWSQTLSVLWKRWVENRQMLEDREVIKHLEGL